MPLSPCKFRFAVQIHKGFTIGVADLFQKLSLQSWNRANKTVCGVFMAKDLCLLEQRPHKRIKRLNNLLFRVLTFSIIKVRVHDLTTRKKKELKLSIRKVKWKTNELKKTKLFCLHFSLQITIKALTTSPIEWRKATKLFNHEIYIWIYRCKTIVKYYFIKLT